MREENIIEKEIYVSEVEEEIGLYRDVMGMEKVGKVRERNEYLGVEMEL